MNLYIASDVMDKQFDGVTCKLPIWLLDHSTVHLFIASNRWETMTVELNESFPENVLQYITMQVDKTVCVLPAKQTDKIMRLLCEAYPEKAGKLRRCFMLGKDMREVLNE